MRPLLAERLADNTLDSYRAGAELRLAQVYELDSEDVGSITSKFQVSRILHIKANDFYLPLDSPL